MSDGMRSLSPEIISRAEIVRETISGLLALVDINGGPSDIVERMCAAARQLTAIDERSIVADALAVVQHAETALADFLAWDRRQLPGP